jgi:ankyrin repeat protein
MEKELFEAISNDDIETFKKIFDDGETYINKMDDNGSTFLHKALEFGSNKIANLLVENKKIHEIVNNRDNSENTPFILAIKNNNFEMVGKLLECGEMSYHSDK